MPTISSAADVEAALFSQALAPPPPPSTLHTGATKRLRQDMARFTSGDDHAVRRSAIDHLVASIDVFPFAAESQRRTAAALAADATEVVADIAYVVPVETMAAALGIADAELESTRRDVRSVVEVIGRGHPSSKNTDDAATRLESRFGGPGEDATARVSLLYQTHDATAALFTTMLASHLTTSIRRPAVSATARVAIALYDGALVGTPFTLDLASARLEFGAGPHRCPGRSIAERIVAGMLHALEVAAVEVDQARIVYDDDGRPSSMPIAE